MASSQLAKEGLGEHALEFDGIESSLVFSGSLERVQFGGEVARRTLDIGARGLLRRYAPAEGFYLLVERNISQYVSIAE